MELKDVLDDITSRCKKAEAELQSFCDTADRLGEVAELARLDGKRQGVALVRDWIRSYR